MFSCKEFAKNAEDEVKDRAKETEWVEGGIIPRLVGSKTFTSCFAAAAQDQSTWITQYTCILDVIYTLLCGKEIPGFLS